MINIEPAQKLPYDASAEWSSLVRLTGPKPCFPDRPVNWEWIVDLALRHKSVLLLARGVERTAGVRVPDFARHRLRTASRERARQALFLAHEAGLVSKAMREAGVTVSVIKGAPLSQIIHGDLAARDIGDIDLLIPADQISKAAFVLDDLSLRSEYRELLKTARQRNRCMRGTNQIRFFDPMKKTCVELHWRWQKFEGMMPTDNHRAWHHVQMLDGMTEVLVPNGIEHFIYLCAHGLSHGWSRLKWLNDIRWTVHNGRLVENDWEGVVERAREIGMSSAVGAAVLAATRVDTTVMPEPIKRLVHDQPQCEKLAARSLEQMQKSAPFLEDPPPERGPLQMARGLMRYVDASVADHPMGLATKLRTLFAPSLAELTMIDLPSGLGFGYFFIRAARMGRRALFD